MMKTLRLALLLVAAVCVAVAQAESIANDPYTLSDGTVVIPNGEDRAAEDVAADAKDNTYTTLQHGSPMSGYGRALRHHCVGLSRIMNTLPPEVCVAVVRFLAHVDALRWLVSALEYDHHALATTLRRHNAVYPLAHRTSQAVACAASHGCVRAMATLLAPGSMPLAVSSDKLRDYVAATLRKKLPASVLHDAVRHCDDDAYVRWLVSLCRTHRDDPSVMLQLAAKQRRLALFQWLADHYASMGVRTLAPLGDGGDYACCVAMRPQDDDGVLVRSLFVDTANGLAPEVCYSLYGGLQPPLYAAMDHAADIGDLALLQRLHEDPRVSWPCTTRAMDAAAANGRLDIVQWLHALREEGCSLRAMDVAARNGHFDVVKWLYYFRQENGSASAYDNAASRGHLCVLKWQRTRFVGFKLSTWALEEAALGGHLQTLEWVDETHARVQITVTMVQNAVNGGHLELLQWLVSKLQAENETPRSFLQSHFISQSAASGNLALLQWLWLEFATLPHDALHHALVSGSLSVVRWLMDVQPTEEQRLRADTLWRMAAGDQWTALEWLVESHPRLWEGACEFLGSGVLARIGKQPKTVAWLHRYTRVMLLHAPAKCLAEPKLPEWAARHSLDDILDQLLTLSHPSIVSKRVLQWLLLSSASRTASRVVGMIVSQHPDWISSRVVQWAATYSYTALLTTILSRYSAHGVAVLRSALFTACRHDQMVVVEWVDHESTHRDSVTGPSIDLWRGSALVAARFDSVGVLQWLQERNRSRETPSELLSAAVQNGSLRLLQRLLQHTTTANRLMEINARDVLTAIGRRHIGVIAWLHTHDDSEQVITATTSLYSVQNDSDLLSTRWAAPQTSTTRS